MAKLHVLLADGDDRFRVNGQRALTKQGYFVLPAATAQEAITLIEKEAVDVVIADIELLSPDEVEQAHKERNTAATPPVLLVAEPRMVAAAANGVRQGAVDYVLKPIDDFTRLGAMIERAVFPNTVVNEATAHAAEREFIDSIAGHFLDAAAQGLELQQLLTLYSEELGKLAQAQAITLLYQENGHLQVSAAYGYADQAEATRAFEQPGTEDLAWRAINAREALWQNDLAGSQERSDSVQDIFAIPLLYAGRVLGLTLVELLRPRKDLTAPLLRVMQRLGQQAAIAVELARVRDLAERRNPADGVTGLLTRSYFFELADREFRRSWRFGEPIGALELDVDDYARIQLFMGAAGADGVMQQVARAVRPRLRSIDVVGRIDAGKLGILVLMGTRETVMAVGERLRRAVAEIELPTQDGAWQITVSIGAATYPREQCASVHDLFGFAAQATHAAKRAGRNRVVGV